MKTAIVVVLVSLALAGTAAGASFSNRTLSDAHIGQGKPELQAQMDYSSRMQNFFRVKHRWMIAARHGNCWSHVPWAKTCNLARLTLRKHERLYATAKARYDRLYGFPMTRDWLTAAEIVQRWFPNTYWWLYWCSNGEGGHGAWVPNTGGSGAGGWMQYMSGTFFGDFDNAVGYLAGRGVRVPSSLRNWYDPLGQAVAAGWARYTRHTPPGKWTGGGC